MPVESALKVHLQEVVGDDAILQVGICVAQIGHTLVIELHDLQLPAFGYKELREHTHSRPNLQYGQVWPGIYGVCDAACYAEVCQEMLAKGLLGANCGHGGGNYEL